MRIDAVSGDRYYYNWAYAPASAPPATPETPLAALMDVPLGNDDESIRRYADGAMNTAQASRDVADNLYAKWFDRTKPDSDNEASNPAAWAEYTIARGVAAEDEARAQQAVAALLRLTSNPEKRNAEDSKAAASAFLQLRLDDTAAQGTVNAALSTVLNESRGARRTADATYAMHRQAAHLDNLIARQKQDRSISDAQIVAARKDFETAQANVLKLVGSELSQMTSSAGTGVRLNPSWQTNADILRNRSAHDSGWRRVVDAAEVIHRVGIERDAGRQFNVLGAALSDGVDQRTAHLVMRDERIGKVIDRYVEDSAAAVVEAYEHHGGAIAAARMLRDVCNPIDHRAMTPEIAARIINARGTQDTIARIATDLQALKPDLMAGTAPDGKGVLDATGAETSTIVIESLSQAVDVVSAGVSVDGHANSGDVPTAIANVARIMAEHPASLAYRVGFRHAVGEGYATLALETANQFHMQLTAGKHREQVGAPQPTTTEADLMGAIDDGLRDLHTKVTTTFEANMEAMAPLLAQQKYSQSITREQYASGMEALWNDADLKSGVTANRAQIEALGYRVVRTDSAVSLYKEKLDALEYQSKQTTQTPFTTGPLKGGDWLNKTRDELMSDQNTVMTLGLSRSAQERMYTQILEGQWNDDLKNGVRDAQWFTLGSQSVGDFPEFIAERHFLSNRYAVEIARSRGWDTSSFKETRFGSTGLGVIPWGVGGVLQLKALSYFRDHLHIGADSPDAEIREALLQTMMFGFGTLHTAQAGMTVARVPFITRGGDLRPWVDSVLGAVDSKFNWRPPVTGERLDKITGMVIAPTRPLIAMLGALMAVAVAWDGLGVIDNVTGRTTEKNTNTVTVKTGFQYANLTMDGILLRLQLREFALQTIGREALESGIYTGLTSRAAGELILEQGAKRGLLAWLGRSAVLNALGPHIGLIVNIVYLATTVGNWAWDHHIALDKANKYGQMFLEGAGLAHDQAVKMAHHEWWGANSVAEPFIKMYTELGGDPKQFLTYLNSIDPNKLDHLLEGLKAARDINELPESADNDYWLLPANPDTADVKLRERYQQLNPNLKLNPNTKRWEDSKLGMYYDKNGVWKPIDTASTPLLDYHFWESGYDAANHMEVRFGARHLLPIPTSASAPKSESGLKIWMLSQGMPLPQKSVVADPKEGPSIPASVAKSDDDWDSWWNPFDGPH